MKNLFAYTAFTPYYPEFVSINEEENGDVTVTVRAKCSLEGACGETISVTVPKEKWNDIRR